MDNLLKLFLFHTNYEISDLLLKNTKFYYGINNNSIIIETYDKKKWQIKKTINFEKSILTEIKYLKKNWNKIFYFGNDYYIKELKDGRHPSLKLLLNNLDALNNEIELFHKGKKKLKVNYYKYLNKNLNVNDLLIYRKLLMKHQNSKIVSSHNDLNLKNLLFSKKKFIFIDFEWTLDNYEWFDIINIIRESNIQYEDLKLFIKYFKYLKNIEAILEFLYINTFFAYSWITNLKDNKNNKKKIYLDQISRQLKNIKLWLKME